MKTIPIEDLFGNPERTSPRLSPDGARLAWLAPRDGVLNVWLREADGRVRPLTGDRRRGIHHFLWAEDNQHLLYQQDTDGDENWHIFAIDPDTGLVRDLTPFVGVKSHLLAVRAERPRELLAGCHVRSATHMDVYLVSLATGAMVMLEENPGDLSGWLVDRHLDVIGATRHTEDGTTEFLARPEPKEDWRIIRRYGFEDSFSSVIGDAPDGGFYVCESIGRESLALVHLSRDGATGRTLAADPRFDLDDLLIHPVTRALQGYAFHADRPRWTYVDPAMAADFKTLEAKLGEEVRLVARDRADRVWVVRTDRADAPAAYHLFRRDTGAAEFLFHDRPALAGYRLAPMTPVTIPARDGLELQSYLTLPPDGAAGPRPLVLYVHGGPNARDTLRYEPTVQLLANRGYAVLQVNFRGSTGFGKKFVNAANREWGGKMHDDLVDAVEWAVANGHARRDRIAIYGGSYGGYAALCGATLTPDLFRCAVDLFGPSNLVTLFENIPPSWKPFESLIHLRDGHPVKDREFLLARSPLTHVERVKIPILIAQGANDPRVTQLESDQIVGRLRALGREVEYVLYHDEGHGFRRPANRIAFIRTAEAFLARHLAS